MVAQRAQVCFGVNAVIKYLILVFPGPLQLGVVAGGQHSVRCHSLIQAGPGDEGVGRPGVRPVLPHGGMGGGYQPCVTLSKQ